MTGNEMRKIREAAGLTIRDLGATLRYKDIRGLQRMEDGEQPISGPVTIILEMMRDGEFPDGRFVAGEHSTGKRWKNQS